MMRRLTRDFRMMNFDKDSAPAIEIEPEEKLVVETNLSAKPATGPIAVRGVEPGDALVITIHDIKISEAHWWYWIDDKAYCRQEVYREMAEFLKEYPVRVHPRLGRGIDLTFPIENSHVFLSNDLKVPLNPLVGVIGVAPSGEAIPTNLVGHHGGNLDCRDIAVGTKVYLPVHAPGGLLGICDIHGLQPDGDVLPCIESSGEVTISAKVRKGLCLPMIFIETADCIASIGCGDGVDKATNDAIRGMMQILQSHMGLSLIEAAQLVGASVDIRICQLIDPIITIRAALPKRIVPRLIL